MILIWTTYVVAAILTSGVFIVAGWRGQQAGCFGSARSRDSLMSDPLCGDASLDCSDTSQQADVGAALRLAVKRLSPVMASQSIQAEIAAPLGLQVRIRGGVLTDLLEEMLAAVVHGAPASRILLAAARQGDRVAITITDDMPGADTTVRRADVRGLIERVALRGAVLDVDCRPSEGTTMTLRLTEAHQEQMDFYPREVARDIKPGTMAAAASRRV